MEITRVELDATYGPIMRIWSNKYSWIINFCPDDRLIISSRINTPEIEKEVKVDDYSFDGIEKYIESLIASAGLVANEFRYIYHPGLGTWNIVRDLYITDIRNYLKQAGRI